jgi:hypothetical protein
MTILKKIVELLKRLFMTLNSSGPISLGGTTTGQSIAVENGGTGTTQISLNDTAVRNLAGVSSGAIVMPTNFYGKSNFTFSGWNAYVTPFIFPAYSLNKVFTASNGYSYMLGSPYITRSTDGNTWGSRYTFTGTTGSLYGMAEGPGGKLMVVGYNNSTVNPIFSVSTDNGATWSALTIIASTYLGLTTLACNGSGVWVTQGRDSGLIPRLYRSTDGTNWTGPYNYGTYTGQSGPSMIFVKSDNTFVAVIPDTNYALMYSTSSDGITWTNPVTITGNNYYTANNSNWGAMNSSGRMVVVGNAASGAFRLYSDDGTTWIGPTTISSGTFFGRLGPINAIGAQRGGNGFVAAGLVSDINTFTDFITYTSSADGVTFTTIALGPGTGAYTNPINSVAANSSGKFYATSSVGAFKSI